MEMTKVNYFDGDTELESLLFRPSCRDGHFPAMLLIHEFTGIGPYMYPHAERLARSGYMVLVHDMYGKGNRPADREEASVTAMPFKKDRSLMRARTAAGLRELLSFSKVDPSRVFAMGFSFGGCSVLELARSGAPLAGSICVYGHLDTPFPDDAENIKGSVLVIHGGSDPVIGNEEILTFLDEMKAADVDCRIKVFGLAGHGFLNSSLAGGDVGSGFYYSPTFEKLAWAEIESFLNELS